MKMRRVALQELISTVVSRSMKKKIEFIILIILSVTMLGCITSVRPGSDSMVVLNQNHSYQTYIIRTDNESDITTSTSSIEVSIDDIYQTTLVPDNNLPQGTDDDRDDVAYSWTVNGYNISKGKHTIKFNEIGSLEGSVIRSLTNSVGINSSVENNSNTKAGNADGSDLILLLIGLAVIAFFIIMAIYKVSAIYMKKRSYFKDLILTCPNCKEKEIFHNFAKDDLIKIYKCKICGSPRFLDIKINKKKEESLDDLLKGTKEK
jgi:hypothetical protein